MIRSGRPAVPRVGIPDMGASSPLRAAAAMGSDGRLLDAIELLMEANRTRRDFAIERELVHVRHAAVKQLDLASRSEASPPVTEERASVEDVPPVVSAEQLTPAVLRSGILRHGSLHARGVVPESSVRLLVDGIDRATAAADSFWAAERQSEPSEWFEPFKVEPASPRGVNRELWYLREVFRDGGCVCAADSPRMLYEFLTIFHDTGLAHLISEYLGERPVLTANKSVLRRGRLETSADWHQDGAFLGDGIKTINLWISLSHCGRDAPGLEVLPARLDGLLETGTEGANFDWSVGPGVVERVAAATPVQRPSFEPGDVLFFDDLFLHRTATDPALTQDRYAIESWFFAPSASPEGYVALLA